MRSWQGSQIPWLKRLISSSRVVLSCWARASSLLGRSLHQAQIITISISLSFEFFSIILWFIRFKISIWKLISLYAVHFNQGSVDCLHEPFGILFAFFRCFHSRDVWKNPSKIPGILSVETGPESNAGYPDLIDYSSTVSVMKLHDPNGVIKMLFYYPIIVCRHFRLWFNHWFWLSK